MVVLGTELRAGHVEDLKEQIGVERCRHTHRLGEVGHIAHVCSSVQGLTPPEELLDTQSRYGRTLIEHQHGFLFQRQSATEILGALLGTQVGVLVRKSLCRH